MFQADVTGGCWPPVTGTHYNIVIVTENHLRFVIGRHIACKRLIDVHKFRVHVD